MPEPLDAAQQKAGGNQHDDSSRELAADQHAPGAVAKCAADDRTAAALQHRLDVAADSDCRDDRGGAQRRRRCRAGKEQRPPIERGIGEPRHPGRKRHDEHRQQCVGRDRCGCGGDDGQ
jgi:hypothetical protein